MIPAYNDRFDTHRLPPRDPRRRVRFPSCVLHGAAALAVCLAGCGSPYLLTVEDRVCRIGEKTRLVGKLQYRGVGMFNKGVDDRDLTFYIDGRRLDRGTRVQRPEPVLVPKL